MNWAREVEWLSVLAVGFVLLAIVFAFVAVFVASWSVVALVFGFSAVALALIGLRA
jgi:hypothetical protein